jgi:hypothetical protein
MALVGGIFCTARIFKYRVNIIEILNTLRKEMDKMTNLIAIYNTKIYSGSSICGGFAISGDGFVGGDITKYDFLFF